MKSEVMWDLLEMVFKIIGFLITVCVVAAWTIILVGLFVHLFNFAWSAFT